MTLVEVMVAAGILVIILLVFFETFGSLSKVVLRYRTRNALDAQARNAVDIMIPHLKKGIARTAAYCNCGGEPCPNPGGSCANPTPVELSQIEFNTFDYTAGLSTFTFFWKDGTLWMRDDLAGRPPRTAPRPIAHDVVSVRFQPNTMDPGLLYVSLELETLKGGREHYRVLLPQIAVRMIGER